KDDQDFYSDSELGQMFKNMPEITNNLIIDGEKKNEYEKFKKNDTEIKKNDTEIKKKNTDDLCPICLDDLENNTELDYCKFSCGKSIHKLCYSMWTKNKESICIFCKSNWYNKKIELKYLNLNIK